MSANPPTTQHEQSRPLMPASPPEGPTSLPANKPLFIHSQHPVSPPSSTSPSHIDYSTISSPLASEFTPPTSAPMSAQTSQHNPPINYDMSEPQHGQQTLDNDKDRDGDAQMRGGYDAEPQIPSNAKRKMEDGDENDATSNKRRKTEEREVEPMNDIGASEEAGPSYGPFPGLCETALPRSRPHVGENLIRLYNLDDTAASVARFDPVTGAKTNTLYKSYLSKIKDLSGKNKPNVAPGDLTNLMRIGDEDWENTQIRGKEIETGLSSSFMAKVSKAVQLSTASLPDKLLSEWNGMLIDPSSSKRSTSTHSRVPSAQQPTTGNSKPATTVNTGVSKVPSYDAMSPATAEANRPKRRGTKRRYDDDSFEGYTDTFDRSTYVEEEDSMDGDEDASTGRRGSASKKRRRKDPSATSPTTFGRGINSQSPVTVGYGSNYYGNR